MDIEAYFERIGYQNPRNKLDLQTLTEILQHQIRAIPFENLNIHCGKPMELSLEAIFDHVVRKKRGGWCLQLNHLLYWALTTIGFETTMLGGRVYVSSASKYSNTMLHLLLQVTLSGQKYIVDAAFPFSSQMWEPLELISGKDQPQVPAIFHLTEENGTWYLDQTIRQQYVPNQEFIDSNLLKKNNYRKIYSFPLDPLTIEDFETVSSYYQVAPTSVMVNTSLCSLQTQDGVHGLLGTIIAYKKFNYKDNVDLVELKTLKEEEVEEVLKRIFGIHLETKFVPKHGNDVFTF
ncbi:arylamine N-acetyltransferase 3-like [Peromyscus maniculatus bairdii]|uniref:arylamine N-acetyltransferase n=1 Tax=Peromyscus maniculatus bairdii TaxID=230844 RepID=A0A6J0E541_PERMB|nr:arylamine N-acetyltransferase 3-like [Peromyscus maniculatus bairdii]XP_042118759.1 arylamine N-acetyltransferase 3-like [Peromyscus maniculatus bairdii]